jgi:glutaredoxin
MRILFFSFWIFVVATSNVSADTLYRWTDKDGKVHYGDKPAEGAVKAEQKKFSAASSAGDDDLPYSIRKAKQDFPVTLYSAQNCADLCVQARALLNKRGVPFVEKNLVTQQDIDEFKKKAGGSSIPSLTVGRTLLTGFEAGQWDSELDIAGYPKTAPYGVRPTAPVVAKPVANPETEK